MNHTQQRQREATRRQRTRSGTRRKDKRELNRRRANRVGFCFSLRVYSLSVVHAGRLPPNLNAAEILASVSAPRKGERRANLVAEKEQGQGRGEVNDDAIFRIERLFLAFVT